MASEDNVVRLKQLQPLAGLSFPNGDNVVRLKHLVSLANAIADETGSSNIVGIKSLSIEPRAPSFSLDEDVQKSATVLAVTDPIDAPVSLSIPDAPEWISIEDNVLVFSPPANTETGNYSLNIIATTAASLQATLNVKQRLSPNLTITSPKNSTTASSLAPSIGSYRVYISYQFTFYGRRADRQITISGYAPRYTTNARYNEYANLVEIYDENTNITTCTAKVHLEYWTTTTADTISGSKTATATITIAGNDEYKEQSATVTIKNCYATTKISNTYN